MGAKTILDSAGQQAHDRKDHSADQISVDNGIQRDAAKITGSRVAQQVCRKGVRRFVHAQRQKQHNKLDGGEEKIHVHMGSSYHGRCLDSLELPPKEIEKLDECRSNDPKIRSFKLDPNAKGWSVQFQTSGFWDR